MKIDFSTINLEVIDLNVNVFPDIFINQKAVTFSKRVLEDLNYSQYVQYCVDVPNKIFAIRACKGSEAKATPFSNPKGEQTKQLSCTNKNLRDTIFALIPDAESNQRYKVTGEYDAENRVIYFDMTTAQADNYFKNSAE
ncbi:MAG: hypothetical protein J6V49_07500 [Bacteroidales bacterium]|nr:hypothetical protein [Bacteroidales bacterium]